MSESEVKELEKSYNHLCGSPFNARQQSITLQIFSNVLTPVLPPMLIPEFFDAFDENRDGKARRLASKCPRNLTDPILECIDFKEFVCGISAACRGPQVERLKCKCISKDESFSIEFLFSFNN